MSTFQLTIVTPDGEYYHGPAESLTVRATTGELTLLAHHIDFVTALGMGEARVTIDGQKRYAACLTSSKSHAPRQNEKEPLKERFLFRYL